MVAVCCTIWNWLTLPEQFPLRTGVCDSCVEMELLDTAVFVVEKGFQSVCIFTFAAS